MDLDNELDQLKRSGADTEALLAAMRKGGCSVVESIKRLMTIRELPLGEAKIVVHRSRAWRDLRDPHERFHEQLTNGLDEEISSEKES